MPNGEYDYSCVLDASMLFYEAQQAGRTPPNTRLPWKAPAMVNVKGPNGADLSKGWFDAGDFVKFNLPQAYTLVTLAWSILEFSPGYQRANLLDRAVNNVRWAADYMMNCYIDTSSSVAQVANASVDHALWRRASDVQEKPVIVTFDGSMGGADLMSMMAAAMASVAVLYADTDATYSAAALTAAQGFMAQAEANQVFYWQFDEDAAPYYKTDSIYDKMAFAAAWLYRATKDAKWSEKADGYITQHESSEAAGAACRYFWGNVGMGTYLLLARTTKSSTYLGKAQTCMQAIITPGQNNLAGVRYTSKGLAFVDSWGSLRYSTALSFMALMYADTISDGAPKRQAQCFAVGQVRYVLGDAGRSYVVGVGDNPPCRVHSRSASCAPAPASCSWADYAKHDCNPIVLYGALVGGPSESDVYSDKRDNIKQNEAAVDYNAGFTGALAAMLHSNTTNEGCGDLRNAAAPAASSGLLGAVLAVCLAMLLQRH